MGTYTKLKKAGVGFLHWLEVDFGGWAARRSINRKLHKRYLKNVQKSDPEYNRKVEAYWKPYGVRFDKDWHRFYSQSTGMQDPRFIPDDIYFTVIDRHLNQRHLARGLKDKNHFSLLFPEIKHPKVVVRRMNGQWVSENHEIMTSDEAYHLLSKQQDLIIKPSIQSGGGKGIEFWQATDGMDDLHKKVEKTGQNVIVQQVIEQHENLAHLHKESVNTVRMMTFADRGKVHVLSSVLRMGIGGKRVDNAHAGGISAGILPSGQLKSFAFSEDGVRYDQHPSGAKFEDCTIPNFGSLMDQIQRMHGKLLHFRLLSWDIAIGKDAQPILVEANLYCGAIDLLQLNNGPLFGELTERVLEDIYGK